MTEPDDNLQQWVGRTRTIPDTIDERQTRLMALTLDLDADAISAQGSALPPLWHMIYFHEAVAMHEIGHDGHAKLGGFLPPISLSRRMYAGGRFTFHKPIRIGDTATKTSTVTSIAPKQGRSGPMCFVTVRHDILAGGELCLSEEQDIVYLEPRPQDAQTRSPRGDPAEAGVSRTITPHPTWLFRYSALTFNGHRIHYDLDFCRDVENYPGLVVHGPLLATLLAGLAAEQAGPSGLKDFAFRAVSPIFHDRSFSINAAADPGLGKVWASNPDGHLAVEAEFH